MTDGQFWFLLTCGVVLLDAISYVSRVRDQRDHRKWLAEYDAESKRRHEEFMHAMTVNKPGHAIDAGKRQP